MRDNNIQIGGAGNSQKIVNNPSKKSWQDNIMLFIIVGVLIGALGIIIAKWLGF